MAQIVDGQVLDPGRLTDALKGLGDRVGDDDPRRPSKNALPMMPSLLRARKAREP